MLNAARIARQVSARPSRTLTSSLPARAFASKAPKSPPKATAVASSSSTPSSSSRPKPDSPASEQPPATNLSSEPTTSPTTENAEPTPAAPLPNLNSLDFTSTLADAAIAAPAGTPDAVAGQQRTGARSARNTKSSSEKRRGVMGRLALGVFAAGAAFFTYDQGREWSVEEVKAKKWRDDQVPTTRFERTKVRFQDALGVFSEPQWEELLPPPQPGQKPMTLIISLDDLLVTSTWDRSNGWRTAKRPGVDYFLAYLSQFYEIVIWTTQHHYTAAPILEKLDPYHFFIAYQLFRESTRVSNGATVVKDLSYLNRDLSKVLVLDTDPDAVSSHPSNSVIVPPWKGTPGDKGLVALIPFLESIGIYQPQDVRPILDAYRGKDVALEYAKTEAIAKAEHLEKHKHSAGGASSMTLTGLFSSGNSRPAGAAPPTYLEMKRAEAQALYRQEQAYIREHKAEFDRLIEEDRQAQMAGGSMMDWIMGSKPEGTEKVPEGTAAAK